MELKTKRTFIDRVTIYHLPELQSLATKWAADHRYTVKGTTGPDGSGMCKMVCEKIMKPQMSFVPGRGRIRTIDVEDLKAL